MKIIATIEIITTKPDMYGNTYSRARVTHTANGKTTPWLKCNSRGNVENVFRQLLDCDYSALRSFESCTDSARLSSLPEGVYAPLPDFAKMLRGIGFTVPAARVTDAGGCL